MKFFLPCVVALIYNTHRSDAFAPILTRAGSRNLVPSTSPGGKVPFQQPSTGFGSPISTAPPTSPQTSSSSSSSSSSRLYFGIELAGTVFDSTATAFDAWEWTNAIGAPAALVAGAVLVTLAETREETSPRKSDAPRIRTLKLLMRFLLLSSFAFEVVSIFCATMTGSILLGHGEQTVARKMIGYASPLQLLHHHFELEYLTTQICFLQGLIHWLGAVAVELLLPKSAETKSAQNMNRCLAGWLATMVIWMVAFYNHHLSFYSDYFTMLRRFTFLMVQRYVFETPIRPLSLLYIPSFLFSVRSTWKAFRSPAEQDDD